MQKQTDEQINKKFPTSAPMLLLSTERIEIEVQEGSDSTGEFKITSQNHVPIGAKIYTSSPRMECQITETDEEATVSYQFHSEGLTEGDIQKGEFYIICSRGEYNLSFVVMIVREYVKADGETIKDVGDFAKFAQKNWQEAKKLFYSRHFENLLKRDEIKERLFYEGLRAAGKTEQNMEEFLLTAGKKQKVRLEAEETEFEFFNIKETVQGSVSLQKSTWGYTEFSVKSDAPFLEPEKTKIDASDFLGSLYELKFQIKPELMHAGKNFACLVLENTCEQLIIRVSAAKEETSAQKDETAHEVRKLHVRLLKLYAEYRLKKIVTGKWTVGACEILDKLSSYQKENVWYRLFKAQALLINSQRQEAEWILSDFKHIWKDKKSPEWGYYLYLCTLTEQEEIYVSRLTAEIEAIYLAHKENPMLFWCLLFLRDEYVSDSYKKLKAIRKRIMSGRESQIFYVEAYCMYRREPYLLQKFGAFEQRILNWARKQKMLTKELSEQLADVFPEKLEYQRLTLLLLEACYEQTKDEKMLAVLCGYLIRNQKYGKRYFEWYQKGVEEKLRITGLYEAYVMSMDTKGVIEVPKIILMYFKYNNQLDYHRKAVLYVNIIANKETQPQIYEQYEETMREFAKEQIKLCHIDDNLAVIYNEMLSADCIDEELAQSLDKILFVHKLTCFEKNAVRVIIKQKQLEKAQIVPLIGGTAYFPLYSNEYCIFIEDNKGNLYGNSIPCQLEKLMYTGKFIRSCIRENPTSVPYLLYYFSSREAVEYIEEKEFFYLSVLLKEKKIDRTYRAWLTVRLIRLLQQTGREGEIDDCLKEAEIALLSGEERDALLHLLVERHLYEKAYELVGSFGAEGLSVSDRASLFTVQIEKIEFAYDKKLLDLTADTYRKGTYSETMLRYLSMYYEAPTKQMAELWKSAGAFETETTSLEERILEQMFETTEYIDCVSDIYKSYAPLGKRKIKEAYLTYFSYYYFVKDSVPPEHFLEELLAFFKDEGKMQMVCELAFLKCFSEEKERSKEAIQAADKLLQKYVKAGVAFAFYKNMGCEMIQKYHFYDKYYIEYHTENDCFVQLYYKSEEQTEYATEEMTEMFEGIYVKEVVLFAGDVLQYYISEETDGEQAVKVSGAITCENAEDKPYAEGGRYALLGELSELYRNKKGKELSEALAYYRQLEAKTQEMFTILES